MSYGIENAGQLSPKESLLLEQLMRMPTNRINVDRAVATGNPYDMLLPGVINTKIQGLGADTVDFSRNIQQKEKVGIWTKVAAGVVATAGTVAAAVLLKGKGKNLYGTIKNASTGLLNKGKSLVNAEKGGIIDTAKTKLSEIKDASVNIVKKYLPKKATA